METPALENPLRAFLARHGYPSVKAFAKKHRDKRGISHHLNRHFTGVRKLNATIVASIAAAVGAPVEDVAQDLGFDPYKRSA